MVLGHPHAPGLPDSWSAKRRAVTNGVPALLIPESWPATRPVRQDLLIAWNASLARSVTVLVMDAAKTPKRFGADPGADISLLLTHHTGPLELRQVTSGGRSIAETILATAATDIVAFLSGSAAVFTLGGVHQKDWSLIP